MKMKEPAVPIPGTKPLFFTRPKIVVEAKYHEITSGGKLRMPEFLRVRDDKTPKQCVEFN